MKKFTCLFFSFSLAMSCLSQTAMFRGAPAHQGVYNASPDRVFTSKAWVFGAGAPIRATPVAVNQTVFIGASNGFMYAVDLPSGKPVWSFNSGSSIESSAAVYQGKLFFTSNEQRLFALDLAKGKPAWTFSFSSAVRYDWGFDYYYSSPVIVDGFVLLGASDGFVYKISAADGKLVWKFRAQGMVRSTPAVADNQVYFGDTEGILHAVDFASGKETWRFKTVGNSLNNEDFGFDRRALISSPAVHGNSVFIGCRDGFLYAVDKDSGKELWRVDHKVSWVISSPAVKDSFVIVGSSDGRFVQAVNATTGAQTWKTPTSSIVWSSAIINGDHVYIGSGEGVLYCLDLKTGKIINRFQAGASIFSSPVISDSMLLFGCDDGKLYALKNGVPHGSVNNLRRYVFYEPGVNNWFRGGADVMLRVYLASNGYKLASTRTLDSLMQLPDAGRTVIVFASNYFPQDILHGHKSSLLRQYLDKGGRVVVCGMNPVVAKYDANKNLNGFDFAKADSVLSIHYGPNDLRAHKGIYPSFATEEGKHWGLQDFWISPLGINASQVDVVLGEDEKGLAAAWIKKYNPSKGGGFVQIWMDQEGNEDLSTVLKAAEYGY